jgi:hypothetical protein
MAGTCSVHRFLGATIGALALAALAVPLPASGTSSEPPPPEPIVGPELPTAYTVPGSPKVAIGTAIGFGGSVYLAVWTGDQGGLWATRIDRAGTVLDLFPIVIDAALPATFASVAFDGRTFLVAWQADGAIWATRISTEGTVLDPAGFLLSSDARSPGNPKISFDGTNSLVVWSDLRPEDGSRDIYGTRVSPDGADLDPVDLVISAAPEDQPGFAIGFNGSEHLLVWSAQGGAFDADVFGTRVTTAGAALDPMGIPISAAVGDQQTPMVTSLGDAFFVGWIDGRSGRWDLYGSRVDGDGTVVDPSGIPIAMAVGQPTGINMASSGSMVLVAWSTSEVRAVRVEESGDVLDPQPIEFESPELYPVVAFDGDNFFVAGWDYSISGTRVTPGGAVLDPAGIPISVAANSQASADMAFDGTNSFVVWFDDRMDGEGPGLYGARVGPDGQILDGTGFPIGNRPPQEYQYYRPSVAFDGSNYLVVWTQEDELSVRAALVSRSGVVLDRFELGRTVDVRVLQPQVAFGGGVFLVAWGGNEVRAARVTSAGEVLEPTGFVVSARGSENIDVAFGRSQFTVVSDAYEGDGGNVYGTLVTPAGVVPDPDGFPISAGEGGQTTPQIAWRGDNHLVVWTDDTGGPSPTSDIRGARVSDSGTVIDPAGIAISTSPGDQRNPTVAANGPFLVTWIDRRRGMGYEDADVFAARVDADGTVAHPHGFPVATSIGPYFRPGIPVVASPGRGNFSVVYERYLLDDQPYTTRSFMRKVTPK